MTETQKRAAIQKKVTGGDEPKVSAETYRIDLIQAVKWYTEYRSIEDYRKWAAWLAKSLGMGSVRFDTALLPHIKTAGLIGRLIERKQHVEQKHIDMAIAQLEEWSKIYASRMESSLDGSKKSMKTAQSKLMMIAGEIEGEIDTITGGKESHMVIGEFLSANKIKSVRARHLSSMFKNTLGEMKSFVSGDKDVKEGYSNITRTNAKKVIAFLDKLMVECDIAAKPPAKVKPAKVKPAKVKKIKNLKKSGG